MEQLTISMVIFHRRLLTPRRRSINQSLLTLGRVITALREAERRSEVTSTDAKMVLMVSFMDV